MKIYEILTYFLVTAITTLTTTCFGMLENTLQHIPREDPRIPKTCSMERVYKLTGYNCANLNLKTIPQNLRSGVEMLDLSFNRIRDLTPDSFGKYTDLKYLYLFENMIQTIEDNTFSHLTDLEAIDLSSNALTTIPFELFRLPLLRNLYVDNNNLKDLHNDLENLAKPITAPLQSLNLVNCKLSKLPNFGVLPELWHLNISTNPISELTAEDLSQLCNLKSIDINYTKMQPCTCELSILYLWKRSIEIKNAIGCDKIRQQDMSYCVDIINSTALAETPEYNECTTLLKSKKLLKESKITWISIGIGSFSCLILIMAILCYCHRKNARKGAKVRAPRELIRDKDAEQLANTTVLMESDTKQNNYNLS